MGKVKQFSQVIGLIFSVLLLTNFKLASNIIIKGLCIVVDFITQIVVKVIPYIN